jgi:hypothetical protein
VAAQRLATCRRLATSAVLGDTFQLTDHRVQSEDGVRIAANGYGHLESSASGEASSLEDEKFSRQRRQSGHILTERNS